MSLVVADFVGTTGLSGLFPVGLQPSIGWTHCPLQGLLSVHYWLRARRSPSRDVFHQSASVSAFTTWLHSRCVHLELQLSGGLSSSQ
jgi:hypothetical protein